MEFEWDSNKADANLKKHDISFEEASTVFNDPLAITFVDPDHSECEERFITIGLAVSDNLLMVAHLDKGKVVRIISSRKLNKQERKAYEYEIK